LAMPDLSRTKESPMYDLVRRIIGIPELNSLDVIKVPEIVRADVSFDLFNFPEDHPARSRSDTYYVDEEHILRTHTTIMWYYYLNHPDIKKRLENKEELGVLCYGKVYRKDEIDRNHMNVFHQFGGLYLVPDDVKELSLDDLKKVKEAVKIPVAVAGGINSESAAKAVLAGADILIVGGAISKSENAEEAARIIRKVISSRRGVKTDLFSRVTGGGVVKALGVVSTANISDAMHRKGELKDIAPLYTPIKMFGRAVTVRTFPGDWAKTVQAVETASRGDVIVIDAGGVGPAVWGELATHGAVQKGIAGVVINGACRDSGEIRKLKFPVFSKIVTPTAGEPKGFGEIVVRFRLYGTHHNLFGAFSGNNDKN